nr:B183 [uncultured bacterium]
MARLSISFCKRTRLQASIGTRTIRAGDLQCRRWQSWARTLAPAPVDPRRAPAGPGR